MKNLFNRLSQVNKNIWFTLIFIFAFFFYLYNITFSDMWVDEAFTFALVKHPISAIGSLIGNDFHPPLYFYGLKIFTSIVGLSVFTIRLFSVLGVLTTIILAYYTGQRVLGKSGALYFCLCIIALPILATYAHVARMYTWGAFFVTGVYLYSVLYIRENKISDLLILLVFSLAAAYTHYYSLVAAFAANLFTLIFLVIKRNPNWRLFLVTSVSTALLYLPWCYFIWPQLKSVKGSFWVPPVTRDTIISCFTGMFIHQFWFPINWEFIVIIYGLTLWVGWKYFAHKNDLRLELVLSLFIFLFTILFFGIASLIIHPILYARYVVNISIMLLIPPVLYFTTAKNDWIKAILIILLLSFGVARGILASSFSYGPYKQTLKYLYEKYPDTKKIVHVLELTVGPFSQYDEYGFNNYWYLSDSTIVYTNIEVFENVRTINSIDRVLKKDENFFVVTFPAMPFNQNNMNRILSASRQEKLDTVVDNKFPYGSIIIYRLQYKGSASRKN